MFQLCPFNRSFEEKCTITNDFGKENRIKQKDKQIDVGIKNVAACNWYISGLFKIEISHLYFNLNYFLDLL